MKQAHKVIIGTEEHSIRDQLNKLKNDPKYASQVRCAEALSDAFNKWFDKEIKLDSSPYDVFVAIAATHNALLVSNLTMRLGHDTIKLAQILEMYFELFDDIRDDGIPTMLKAIDFVNAEKPEGSKVS